MGALIIIAAVLLFAGASGSRPSTGGGAIDMGTGSYKSQLWADLQSVPELTPTQRYFLMLTAYGETGGSFNPRAHNDTASEVAASAEALNNSASLRTRLQRCGLPLSSWAIGSVGLFQRLTPYFGDDMLDIFGENSCEHVRPELGYDRAHAIVSAIKNARALQNYPAFAAKPTVGTLRLGWYGPGAMKQPQDEARLNKYRDHAFKTWGNQLPGFVDRPIERFPGNFREIFARLKAGTSTPPSDSPLELLAPSQWPPAYSERFATTDPGFTTIDWFAYRGLYMRIDTRTSAATPTQRWVVFGNPLHVLAIGEVQTASSVTAAKAAAAWVDVFKGGAVS